MCGTGLHSADVHGVTTTKAGFERHEVRHGQIRMRHNGIDAQGVTLVQFEVRNEVRHDRIRMRHNGIDYVLRCLCILPVVFGLIRVAYGIERIGHPDEHVALLLETLKPNQHIPKPHLRSDDLKNTDG
jgi:hypothetical protein